MSSSVIAQCGNDNHEHQTEIGHDGESLDHLEPMICSHCKRPAHYDFGIEDYRHDDASSCFLMQPSASPCRPL
jgi:hypothetical protein